MDNPVLWALCATLVTWGVTALGAGVVLFFKKADEKWLNLTLGFAAGVMIAASFWSLLDPAIDKAKETLATPAWLVATAGFLCGAVFLWASDKAVRACRKNADKGGGDRFSRMMLLVLSITLHNVPEGAAVGVAFGALAKGAPPEAVAGAVTLALGIALQNFPEGAAVALPLYREGCGRWKSFAVGQASGMVEPAAGVIGALLVTKITVLLPFALAFAAGAMILVAVHELIPECQQNKDAHPYFATAGIVGGFALMMLLDVALGG